MTDKTTIIVQIFFEMDWGDTGRWDYKYKPNKFDISMGWGFHIALGHALESVNCPCSPDEVTMVTFDVVEEVLPLTLVLKKHFARYANEEDALSDLYILMDELSTLTGISIADMKEELETLWADRNWEETK